MTETLLGNEPMLRPAVFLRVLVAMAGWKLAAPCRQQDIPRVIR